MGIKFEKADLLPDFLLKRENCQSLKEKVFFHICKILHDHNKFSAKENVHDTYLDKSLNMNTIMQIA